MKLVRVVVHVVNIEDLMILKTGERELVYIYGIRERLVMS